MKVSRAGTAGFGPLTVSMQQTSHFGVLMMRTQWRRNSAAQLSDSARARIESQFVLAIALLNGLDRLLNYGYVTFLVWLAEPECGSNLD